MPNTPETIADENVDLINDLFYKTRAKNVLTESGKTVEEALSSASLEGHTHSPSDIITDENHRFVSDEQIGSWDLGATYTNDAPTYTDIGGISKGSTFANKSMKEMWDALLYPYVTPTVTVTVTPNGGVYEKGIAVEVSRISVTYSSPSTKITEIVVANSAGQQLAQKVLEAPANSGTESFDMSSYSISTNETLKVTVTTESGQTATVNSKSFSFVYPFYYGAVAASVTEGSDELAKSVTKSVTAKGTKTFAFTCVDQKMMFAYPASYGNLKKIYDTNNFDMTDAFVTSTFNVEAADGSSVPYIAYISDTASTVTNFSMKFEF